MALSSLEQAIILTVSYTDQFSYPLTVSEIWQRLVKRVGEWWLVLPKTTSKKQFNTALKRLLRKGILESDQEFFWLKERSFLVDRRQRRQRISQTKWQEIEPLIRFAAKIPWVSAVFITGSLAMNSADQEDDSDFMIITQPARLWLTRLLISLYAFFKGKRRSWHGEEKRSWCFNLWLEESALVVLDEEYSLYRAYELVQAVCIFDRRQVEKRLHGITPWVKDFLPNAVWAGARSLPQIVRPTGLMTHVNTLAYRLQRWYMSGHMTRERVTPQYAFFHPRDTQGSIIDSWIKSLNELNQAL
jgi:hypothetical protein